MYAGQEAAEEHTPSLFDVDRVNWKEYPLQPLITKLTALKKHPALLNGQFTLLSGSPAIQAIWHLPGNSLFGVFNVQDESGFAYVPLQDGTYFDLLSHEPILVNGGRIELPETAYILEHAEPTNLKPVFSPLLD